MVLIDPLDYTPRASFNDIQFSSESVNVIVSSLLLGMILANLDGIVSRIMNVTPASQLNFRDASRAYIFANSNDLIKLFEWIRGKYPFRHASWSRLPNTIRLRRLTYPLLARTALSIASLFAIAVTLPTTTSRVDCSHVDYQLIIENDAIDKNVGRFVGLCQGIPLVSERGDVVSSLSFCYSPTNISDPRPVDRRTPPPPQNRVLTVMYDREQALVNTGFITNGIFVGLTSFAQWVNPEGKNFRSDLRTTIQPDQLRRLVTDAIAFELGNECTVQADSSPVEDAQDSPLRMEVHNYFLDCGGEFDDFRVLAIGGAFFVSAASWEPTPGVQERYLVTLNGTFTEVTERTEDCPVTVVFVRPIVNLLPLTILWLIALGVNVFIGYLFRKHDDVTDVAFHVMKEAVSGDCTSNVLEKSEQHEHKRSIPLRKSMRGRYGHVGYLSQHGEVVVEEFDPHIVVCNKV